ncbi:Arginine-fifty homeobox like [Actinidia chinensis var. chinensis]|uniref:Arginine-fifty homeobox like n=1 Tax=Actinidia chinensis var. chinensis TaxID=1590841 RepID=A0A2R6QIZ8_ACTCC|nr:Arginine-fifty homeobox like [Actinidia chinensis var. chinensis]
MSAPVAFSSQATAQRTCTKTTVGAFGFSPVKTCQFKSDEMKIVKQQLCVRARVRNKLYKGGKLKVVSSSDTVPTPITPSDIIKQFYACINKKELNQLRGLISDDCLFEDRSFFKPFQGEKDVMDFFGQLIDSMGQNIEFKIGNVCEGDDFMAGVTWHLEWNKKQIPFTRGYSFFECSMEGTKLIIKRAQGVIESPIKPGHSSLILLKMVTSLFDAFPKATEWFLKSPDAILKAILKVYSMVLGPFISPFLAWYIKYWKFMQYLLSSALKILVFLSKIFDK